MADLRKVLSDLGFPSTTYKVENRSSIMDLIRENERCGIYVLHFANEELYAGQAIDVVRRYGQHRKTYDDIVQINFKCVELGKLNSEEKKIIQTLEKTGFHLRNKVHASVTYAPSPFDEILSLDEQASWITNLKFHPNEGTRPINPELRRKYTKSFEKFLRMPFADDILYVLREYIKRCIPSPKASEMYYWSCSCLLQKVNSDLLVYSRINTSQQAVLHIYAFKGQPTFSWHLAKSPLLKTYREARITDGLCIKYDLDLTYDQLKPGGQDQVTLIAYSVDSALKVIKTPHFVQAIRLFNLRLMRKGINLNYKSHCFDLADKLLD